MTKYPFDVRFGLTLSYKWWWEYISKAYAHCAS